jgi:HAD superfamily hydrolase (TIGR01549 family)
LNTQSLAIFDLDGTLLDTSTSICNTLILTLNELKLPPLESTQIIEGIGMPLRAILSPLKLSTDIEAVVVSRFRELLLTNIQEGVKTFPGVIEFINELVRNSVNLAVATSKPTILANESMKFSVLRSFNFNILGSDGLKPKPNPAVVQKVMEQYPGVKNIVMFGDRVEDIIAAREAGIQSVGIAQSAHSMDNLLHAGASLAFKNFEEINLQSAKVIRLLNPIPHVP